MQQTNIFNYHMDYFKLKPPIRLFEAFAGIGTQAMALKRITKEVELVGISEIDKYAIASYRAIHGDVKSYGDITMMDRIPPCDIFTWSFPCTDLSKAGKRLGMSENTRSGLVYHMLRLLKRSGNYVPHRHISNGNSTIHSIGRPSDEYSPLVKSKLPKVLIMENVPDLIQTAYYVQFRETIIKELEWMGYKNYYQVLNAKDYGVAQNRKRVFMVSIQGDYLYEFPKSIKLEKSLRDYLERDVDEHYYLTKKQIGQIRNWKSHQNPLDNILHDDSKCPTITTRVAETDAGGISASTIVYGGEIRYDEGIRTFKDGCMGALRAERNGEKVVIAKQNDLFAQPLVNHAIKSRDFKNAKWNNICPTLLARDYKDPKVVAYKAGQIRPQNRDYNKINKQRRVTFETRKDDVSNALLTNAKNNMIMEIFSHPQSQLSLEKINDSYYRLHGGKYDHMHDIARRVQNEMDDVRIRKLTPKECWRLMGIDDVDFEKAKEVNSNSQLYKQAGNAIVVDVFEVILRQLIDTE